MRVQLADREIFEWLLGQCDDDFLIGKTLLIWTFWPDRHHVVFKSLGLDPLEKAEWFVANPEIDGIF